MRRYEQVYILRPSLSEDQITAIIENTNQLILDDNGAVIYQNKWGMRKLAYPIKKEAQGYYVLCDFASTPGVVSEIERKFRIDDSVLKYLTIKISDAITAEEIEAARSEAEANAVVPETEEAGEDVQADKAETKKTEAKTAGGAAEEKAEAGDKAETEEASETAQ